jgi:uncharacterized protein (TIRG00374 family)
MNPIKLSIEKGIWKKALLAVLLLGLLVYFGDLSFLTRLPEIKWGFVFLIFLCTLFFSLSHNFRWKGIVDHLSGEKRENFFSLYRYLLNSYAFGIVVPLDVSLAGVRSYYLKQSQQLSTSLAIFSVLLDRFLDVFIFIVLALPSFSFITGVAPASLSFLILILFILGLSLMVHWKKGDTFSFLLKGYHVGLVRVFSKVPVLGKWIHPKGEVTEMECHFDESSVFQIMGWSVVKYIFLSLRFYFTGQALGVPFSLIQGFFIIPFIQLTGFISITPGGLGVVEAGTYGALLLMGIPKSQILLFVFGQRILLIFTLLCLFSLSHLYHFVQSRWRKVESFG